MKKMLISLLLFITVFVLSTCAPSIEEGVVLDKFTEEEYTTVILIPQTISTGKTTITNLIPMAQHYPESYVFVVEGENTDGEVVQENIYVSKSEYDKIEIGGHYVAQDKHSAERTYTEREATSEEQEKYGEE